jgi:hypothetical protein
MVVYACNPSYPGGGGRRSKSLVPAQAKLVKLSQKQHGREGGGREHGLGGRVPVQQAQGSVPYTQHTKSANPLT